MKDLRNRVAVVTGAASGIGLALAERFATEGMKLVLADVEAEPLAAAVAGFEARGVAVTSAIVDVSRAEQVEALADRAWQVFGGAHVVCNNAGVSAGGRSWEIPGSDWEWVLGVNLWGVIHGIRTFVPRMLKQGGPGHVVNTASVAGLLASPGMGPYNVSKFGVVALSETLHHELAMEGSEIKVSVLCPGWVNTKIADADRNHPRGREGRPGNPQFEAMRDVVRGLISKGLAPATVAERVVEAIREEYLYILTHPDFLPMIRNRMDAILEHGEKGVTLH